MMDQLTTHLWQSTIFAVMTALLTVAFRNNRAKVRYWLWLSASVKFIVPFAALMSLGSHMALAPVAHKIVAPDLSFAMERIVLQSFPGTSPFAPAASGTNWAALALLGAWASGFLTIALMRFRSWLRIRAAVRASVPLPIPAAVEIRSSRYLLEPGVVGFLRPILLLPDGITKLLTKSHLEAVLAHELCHVRRRDNLFASIHMIVEAVFWFHPFVWWIGARLVEERERACDEGVLSLGAEPRIYADAILNVCKLYVESPLVCVAGVTGANLKRRIEAIMTHSIGQSLNRTKKLLLAGAGVVALAGPVVIGVMIGAGNPPAAIAQAPVIQAPQIPAPAPAPLLTAAPQAATVPDIRYQNRRLTAMLFDFGAMTEEEKARARQSALEYVSKLQPVELVAILTADRGSVAVRQDFTGDPAVLEPAILRLAGASGSAAAAGVSGVEEAAKLLAAIPGKKSLMYFSTGIGQPGPDPAEIQRAIETAQKSNIAIYPVDMRAAVPQLLAQSGRGGSAQAERESRAVEAQKRFGSSSGAMSRTYIRYGPPDQIEDRGADAQHPSQIWRYNYLENFRSNAEFEFVPGNSSTGMRINWPPPLATYVGTPGGDAVLAEALRRELHDSTPANLTAGIPGGASIQVYPKGEFQRLLLRLDSFSGRVDVIGQVKTATPNDSAGRSVAGFRDVVQPSATPYQAQLSLDEGSYICNLVVRDQVTGQMYGETIRFEVK